MVVATEHPHIVRNSKILGGEPVIKGTRTPIRAIVELWKWGNSPEQTREHFPHVKLSQIFDALSYYADHREEIERHIRENCRPSSF